MTSPRNSRTTATGRTYTIPGYEDTPFPSVTTITGCMPKPFLVKWAAKLVAEAAVTRVHWQAMATADAIDFLKRAPDRARDHAGDRGTAVHAAIEQYMDGKDTSLTPEEAPYFTAALGFLHDHEPHVIYSEATVFHPELRYAGTMDMLADIRAVRTVVDFKTSKSLHADYALQLAAYAFATHLVSGENQRILSFGGAARGVLVHLKPDGTYDTRTVDFSPEVFETFRALAVVQRWVAVHEKKALGPALEIARSKAA